METNAAGGEREKEGAQRSIQDKNRSGGQDLKERKDTINKIMDEILEDMTRSSREKLEQYTAPLEGAEEDENTLNLEEARIKGDWL